MQMSSVNVSAAARTNGTFHNRREANDAPMIPNMLPMKRRCLQQEFHGMSAGKRVEFMPEPQIMLPTISEDFQFPAVKRSISQTFIISQVQTTCMTMDNDEITDDSRKTYHRL